MRLCIRVLIITFLSAVPALLSYLANSNIAFELLIEMGIIGENVDIQIAQDCCLWIGILFSAIALSLNLIVTKTKYDVVVE